MTLVSPPTPATLKKYGLVEEEWWEYFNGQDGKCGVCDNPFLPGKQINIDHEHCKNWKSKSPEVRKIYVRGLCCWTCNRFRLFRGATAKLAYGMYKFLKRYEDRRDAALAELEAKPDEPL